MLRATIQKEICVEDVKPMARWRMRFAEKRGKNRIF